MKHRAETEPAIVTPLSAAWFRQKEEQDEIERYVTDIERKNARKIVQDDDRSGKDKKHAKDKK